MTKRVLIVDDSSTARLIVQRCCEITGLQNAVFLQAGSGKEALDLLERESVDLILSDLNMPVMDGRQLTQALRTDPRFEFIPIVVITSAYNPRLEEELMSYGVSSVLGKPITPATLVKALTRAVMS